MGGAARQEGAKRARRGGAGVTMADVARRAAVSVSTVSLYLRKPSAVAPRTGRAIAEAVEDLGYVTSLVAGGLAAGSSRVVSVIVPSVRNAFFAETVSAIQEELKRERLNVLLGHTEYDLDEEEALVRTALSWKSAAIVLTGLSHAEATLRLLRASRVPVIEVWELGEPPIDSAVGFDHWAVGRTAAAHLLERGRRRLLFLGARLHVDHRARKRAQGFLETARAGGAAADLGEHPAAATAEIGALLLARAFEADPAIDGIAFSNDHMAMGAIFECHRRGIAIPDRLSIVGFGDLDFAAVCHPSLTTIRPSGDLIGRETARIIIESVRSDGRRPGEVVDTHHALIRRLST
ncbi:MAG TPA: LacI family DNA-binding transcriptional regulator [Paracoccaceae bacterium]|nr:LacI family DNA-binding transcriptional regulator [Paracoccaceae bacterium]